MQSSRDDETGKVALGELCRRYWEPLYAFARMSGRSSHDAEDEVQSFLASSLEGKLFSAAQRERGKLRSFLLTAFKRHLVDSYRRETSLKKGGKQKPLSIDKEEGFLEPVTEATEPEIAFDRRWAMRTLEVALEQLELRYSGEDFALYRPFLLDTGNADYEKTAAEHGISYSGFKVGVHRMRKRFREELENAVSATLEESDDLNGEMSYLLEVLSHCKLDGRYVPQS